VVGYLCKLRSDFDEVTINIDESAIWWESVEDLVLALVKAKAEAILTELANTQHYCRSWE
jgi:hypothetical protein